MQKAMDKRKSVRAFDASRSVDVDMVKELVAAAQLAPTWKNSQTGRYHVIMSPELLAEFREECLHPYNAKNSAAAPVLIVTTFVRNVSGFNREGLPDNELGNGWGVYDLGLQNGLLLLKAAELGLDTLVMGLRDADRIRGLLSIPDNEVVVSVIAVGYGAAEPERPPRKTVEDVCEILR